MKDILPPTWYVTVTHSNCCFGRELRISQRDQNTGEIAVAPSVVLTPIAHGAYIPPTMILDDDLAKRLMDALWQSGVRPSHDVGRIGENVTHIWSMNRGNTDEQSRETMRDAICEHLEKRWSDEDTL